MPKTPRRINNAGYSRRHFLKLAGAATATIGSSLAIHAQRFDSGGALSIAKWSHPLPEFDTWFASMAKEWGRQHNVEVNVDTIPVESVYAKAKAETSARSGHDLFIFPWPPAEFQQYTIDHREVYAAVAARYGAIPQIAHASTLNVNSKKYFAFADFWVPCPLLYAADEWATADMFRGPLTYSSLRSGGQRVKDNSGALCGLAFSQTLEGNITASTMLYAFGGPLINRRGVIEITAPTIGALNFAKVLCEETGTSDQLSWGPAGNVQAMLARKTSCTMNSISLVRIAEQQNPELAQKIRVEPPLLGSYGVTAFPHVTNCSSVWNFAKNPNAAKQFLINLVSTSRMGYEKSLGCNFPVYPKTVPDLVVRLQRDPAAVPQDKYMALKDALHWTPNLGAPSVATPIWMEAFNTFVIPRMFARVIKGEANPMDAAKSAEAEIKQIAEKWKDV